MTEERLPPVHPGEVLLEEELGTAQALAQAPPT